DYSVGEDFYLRGKKNEIVEHSGKLLTSSDLTLKSPVPRVLTRHKSPLNRRHRRSTEGLSGRWLAPPAAPKLGGGGAQRQLRWRPKRRRWPNPLAAIRSSSAEAARSGTAATTCCQRLATAGSSAAVGRTSAMKSHLVGPPTPPAGYGWTDRTVSGTSMPSCTACRPPR
ncbi:hypothetical protein BOX15_Mlig009959g2, partial [Macrostomum lignano]